MADLIVINFQETYQSSKGESDPQTSSPPSTFIQNQRDFLEILKQKLLPHKMTCYYSENLISGALTSFFCSNQKIGFKGLSKKPLEGEGKTQLNDPQKSLSFVVQLPGLNVLVLNVQFSNQDLRLRRAQMDLSIREAMIEYEKLANYTTPFLLVLAGNVNSGSLDHLELDSLVMQSTISGY